MALNCQMLQLRTWTERLAVALRRASCSSRSEGGGERDGACPFYLLAKAPFAPEQMGDQPFILVPPGVRGQSCGAGHRTMAPPWAVKSWDA